MTKSPINSEPASTLLPKIISFWQQGNVFIKDAFNTIFDQLRIVIETLQLIFKYIVKQTDKFIDYLARHPVLDKLETSFAEFIFRLSQKKSTLQHSHFYKKAALYAQLTRLDKPIGIFLLLWPTLIALWIAAEGWPDPLVLFVFVMGVILMRSAGCAINDYADREIDGKVRRTKQRPLASGKNNRERNLTGIFVA